MDEVVVILLFASFAVLVLMVQCKPYDSPESFDKTKFFDPTGCLEEHGLDIDGALKFMKNDKFSAQKIQENPKLNCLSNCLFEFADLMDGCSVKDLKPGPHITNEKMIEEAVDAFSTCKSGITATEPCECGNQMAKCLSDLSDESE